MNEINTQEKLVEIIREEAAVLKYIVVNISARSSRGLKLEVAIDTDSGITLDECSSFNRKVVSRVEDEGMEDLAFTLDVASPGLDRVLKSKDEFTWAIGKQVEIRMNEPVDEKKSFIGELLRRDEDGNVIVKDDQGKEICVNSRNVAKVRLHLQL